MWIISNPSLSVIIGGPNSVNSLIIQGFGLIVPLSNIEN